MNVNSLFSKHDDLQQSVLPARLLALISALLCIPAMLLSQQLTLEGAVQTALRNNERMMQYKERTAQKEHANAEAWGNFLPSVRFQGSYNHLNDPLQIDLDPIRQAMIQLQAANQVTFAKMQNPALTPQQQAGVFSQASAQLNQQLPPFIETFKEQDYRSAAFVAVQPLFMGGKLIAAKNFASSELHASQAEQRQVNDEMIREVVNDYLSVVMMNEVVKTRSDVLAGMQRHLRDAERLYEEGLIAPHHRLRARVAVADAERNLTRDENRRDLALVALRSVLGVASDTPIVPVDQMSYVAVSPALGGLISRAHQEQPVLELIASKKKAAAQKFVAERAEFLPQVFAFGKYEVYPQYLSSLEPRWTVGVQLSYPLFTGMQRINRMQSAGHLESELRHLEADSQNKIDLWVNKSYRDVRNAGTMYEKLAADVALAEENYRVNEKRFQTGLGTSLEVVDARLGWEKSQLERLSTLQEYYKALTDLYTAVGEPNEIFTIWNNRGNQQ
jgi:outer membrane protein